MEICLDTRITLGTPISRYDIINSTISSSMTYVTYQSMSMHEAPMFFSQKLQFHNSGFDAIDDAVTAIVGTSWDPKDVWNFGLSDPEWGDLLWFDVDPMFFFRWICDAARCPRWLETKWWWQSCFFWCRFFSPPIRQVGDFYNIWWSLRRHVQQRFCVVFLLPAGYDSLEPEETCQRHDPFVKSREKNYKKVVVSNIVDFHSIWWRFPFWRACFQLGLFNHQLENGSAMLTADMANIC